MLDHETCDTQEIERAVSQFSSYSDHIRRLLSDLALTTYHGSSEEVISGVLNGEAISALKQLVPIEVRRKAGLFFTSTQLADSVAARLAPRLRTGVRVLDPACGAGNLLIACARYLPTGSNLRQTLGMWSDFIVGYDLHQEFVRATQLRLTLLAASKHPEESKILRYLDPSSIFSGLTAGDFFANKRLSDVDCIVVNPPFGHISAPPDCQWSTGRIQTAGFFFERLLRLTYNGQHIAAILPDVLRSGTRYHRWRTMVSKACSSLEAEPIGRFDKDADVDVFILHAVVGGSARSSCEWPRLKVEDEDLPHVVGDFFEVRVGSVVPHRDPLSGPSYPYLHARTAPAWQTLQCINDERKYSGTVFDPPFVIVHRTSSPSDRYRCVATLVDEKRKVAAENHLLILKPKDRSLETCVELMDLLRLDETNDWMNHRIRCRHLTVSALRELPYWTKK
ncbi:MAG: N-6 DNA methylase [Chloroflexi bacterium]|nr:N-6 DNA methylase [Chloroflexota bacterium]